MLGDLLKTKMQTDNAAVDAERQRVAGLLDLKNGLDPALHGQVDQLILDGKTPDEAKGVLFDAARTVQAPKPADPAPSSEPGPIATATQTDTHQADAPAQFGREQVQQYMKTHGVTLQDAIVALAPKS